MAEPSEEFKKGDTVEGYKVLSPLGVGAASLVYLVQDPKSKHIWAMKHVHRDESHKDSRFLDQAEHEYDVASNLNHHGIRKVERLIKLKSGLLKVQGILLVMEFVDGISMEKKPPRENIDLALELFIQSGEALQHMHDRGWVHADMKPNNIMICDGKLAKIIDLGQSCKIGTTKPRIQGTPDYIAPEQVHRRPITPKTDIYNFGATMYWTLTGEFIPTAMAKGDALVDKLDDRQIGRARPAVEVNPLIPPKLSELIMQCVEVDADLRPDTMRGVVEKLQIILGLIRARRIAAQHDLNAGSRAGSGGSRAGAASHDSTRSGGSGVGVRLGDKSGSGMSLNDDSGDPVPVKPMK